MSVVRFISDLHLGHKSILKFAGDYRLGDNIEEHDWWLIAQWNSVVTKRDTTYVLGDVCFDIERLHLLDQMNGSKHLILGNHDTFQLGVYQKHFNKIHGFVKYKNHWLTHAPLHPAELRGRVNIHGHIHQDRWNDPRYINVSVEMSAGVPRSLEELHRDEKAYYDTTSNW